MSDTLVEPPPPTVTDPGPLLEPAPRPARRGATCAVLALIAVLLGAVGAVAVWFFVLRSTAEARAHIPDRAAVVVRVVAADLALFAPVRKHLWPLVTDAEPAPAGATRPTRAARVREATGVSATDVREMVIASTDAASWVLLVGGRMARGRFVSGLARVMQDEGVPGWGMSGEVLVGPGGMAVAQAEDGTIIVGSGVEVARAALPAGEGWRDLGLPEAPASLVVSGDTWKALGRTAFAVPGSDVLGRIRRASGTLTLGDEPAIDLRLTAQEGVDAGELARGVEALLAGLRLGLMLAPDRYGEKEAVAAATTRVEGAEVALHVPWPRFGFDRAAQELADRMRAADAPAASAAPAATPPRR
ncbi:MAG: hypothetical protein WKG00_22200 [Polyangiaceae bacterium]